MAVKHELLGFDARDMSPEHVARWPDRRRHEWLLRNDVQVPLSVDDMVWPSVLLRGGYEAFLGTDWIGFLQNLWENLPRMQQYIRSLIEGIPPHWTIAVGLIADTLLNGERAIWDEIVLPTVPATVDDTWTFLGYDVADRFLSSGLTSYIHCEHADYAQLQSRFVRAINDAHLFDNLDTAVDFRDVCNRRVKSDAPFFIFSMFKAIQERKTGHPQPPAGGSSGREQNREAAR